MRLVLQRVAGAAVRVEAENGLEEVGRIGRGLVVLVGVETGDGPSEASSAAAKLVGLRVFEDDKGAMNKDAAAVGGDFLVVPNFTLAGSLNRGRRPSFDGAARPEDAAPVVEALVASLRERGFAAPTGRFRTRMEVELTNDGPATFVLEVPSPGR